MAPSQPAPCLSSNRLAHSQQLTSCTLDLSSTALQLAGPTHSDLTCFRPSARPAGLAHCMRLRPLRLLPNTAPTQTTITRMYNNNHSNNQHNWQQLEAQQQQYNDYDYAGGAGYVHQGQGQGQGGGWKGQRGGYGGGYEG